MSEPDLPEPRPPLPPGPKTPRHDWTALMFEWARGPQESLESFRARKGLASARFYEVAKAMDWKGVRDRLKTQAIAKAEKRITEDLTKRYSFQMRQWHSVEGIIARALRKLASSTNADILAPEALESLTRSLERALKARKLIHGEPTESGQKETGEDRLSHRQVVDLLKAMAAGDARFVLPETVVDAELVEGSKEEPSEASYMESDDGQEGGDGEGIHD